MTLEADLIATRDIVRLARERQRLAILDALDAGVSAYRVAKLTGLSETHIGRIRRAARSARPR